MIDPEERALIAHLRQNGRIKLTELSRATTIPVSTLFDRMHALKDLGITRVSALLNFAELGYSAHAVMLLKCGNERRDKLRQHLLAAPGVNTLLRINNGYDFLIECAFKDLRCLEEFCDTLERTHGVRTKETHLIVEEIGRERFLAAPEAQP